ncbi:MAG: RidA family protein [Betaproteobacteria bacterium]
MSKGTNNGTIKGTIKGTIQTYGKKNPNLPFHPAVRAGDFVFLSGQVGKDENGAMVAGSIEEETRATLETVKRVLKEAGCELTDVVKVTTFLEDARDFGRYNGVFKEYFPEGRIARTTVEARAVISTKIEIECVAYKPL